MHKFAVSIQREGTWIWCYPLSRSESESQLWPLHSLYSGRTPSTQGSTISRGQWVLENAILQMPSMSLWWEELDELKRAFAQHLEEGLLQFPSDSTGLDLVLQYSRGCKIRGEVSVSVVKLSFETRTCAWISVAGAPRARLCDRSW